MAAPARGVTAACLPTIVPVQLRTLCERKAMNAALSHACAALALATIASAQTTYVIAPDDVALADPSSSSSTWMDSTTGFRSQFIYDTSHFTNIGVTGAIVINRMRFRAGSGIAAGGNYPGNGTTTGIVLDIGTSATDYAMPSTTFATNRGTMQNVMTWGTVTCAASTGPTPNNYVIDIPIPGGFVYDPTLGADLLIDITGSDFIGALPGMSTGESLASRCNCVRNIPSSAATGPTSAGSCPVVRFDIVGPGGYPDNGSGFPILEQTTAIRFGTNCRYSRSFIEVFTTSASFDLA